MNTLILNAIILLSVCCIFLNSCSKLFDKKDDELSIVRKSYDGNQLRIDGYYYRVGFKGEINDGYFFFRNGVLISTGGITLSLDDMDNMMIKNYIDGKRYRKRKIDWGVFVVKGDSIYFERWYPHGPNMAYVRSGKIINDSTFHIKKSFRLVNGLETEIRERDEIYYFRVFSPKPDSTNNFIK